MSQNRKSVCEVVSVLCYAMPPVPQYQCSPLVRSPISVLSSVRRMDEHNSSSVAHIMRPALLARVGVAGLAALGTLALASLIHRELKLAAPGETVLLAPSTWRRNAPAYISARDAVVDLNKFFDGFRDEGPAMIAAESPHAATRTYGHAPKARTVNHRATIHTPPERSMERCRQAAVAGSDGACTVFSASRSNFSRSRSRWRKECKNCYRKCLSSTQRTRDA